MDSWSGREQGEVSVRRRPTIFERDVTGRVSSVEAAELPDDAGKDGQVSLASLIPAVGALMKDPRSPIREAIRPFGIKPHQYVDVARYSLPARLGENWRHGSTMSSARNSDQAYFRQSNGSIKSLSSSCQTELVRVWCGPRPARTPRSVPFQRIAQGTWFAILLQ